jgi:hypothetical protein
MAHRTRRELDGRSITAVLPRQVAVPQPQFIVLIESGDDSRVT